MYSPWNILSIRRTTTPDHLRLHFKIMFIYFKEHLGYWCNPVNKLTHASACHSFKMEFPNISLYFNPIKLLYKLRLQKRVLLLHRENWQEGSWEVTSVPQIHLSISQNSPLRSRGMLLLTKVKSSIENGICNEMYIDNIMQRLLKHPLYERVSDVLYDRFCWSMTNTKPIARRCASIAKCRGVGRLCAYINNSSVWK